MDKFRKYLTIFKLSAFYTLRNYKALFGLSIFLITCLLIFSNLWKVAAARIGGVDLQPEKLLWYIAFNEWLLISLPDVHEEMEQDLRSGKLAYLLPRPISYLVSVFFEGLGALCVNLVTLGIVAFSFTWLAIGTMPFSLGAFAITFALGVLAGCVGLVFQMLIGISAFWLNQVSPFYWIWEKLLFTFGGLLIPLAVYPTWLQTIANLTPFPSILGQRSALALHFSSSDVFSVTSSLLCWGFLATFFLVLLYKRGLKIVSIGGG